MKSFESLYYKLFSIPKPQIMLTASLSAALLLSVVNAAILRLWIAIFLVSLAGVKIAGIKFDLKRVSFLAIFISLISFSSIILGGNVASSSFLLYLTYYFCSEKKLLSLPLSVVPYIATDPSINTAEVLIVSAVLLGIYLKLLGTRVGIVRIRDFVESFVLFWLTSKADYMEKFLLRHSEEFEGKVRCLNIGDISLISTDFHPGPFRNVGGAKLVGMLTGGKGRKGRRDKDRRVYLHSPTSHARNPASEEDVLKITREIECSGEPLKPFKPFKVEGEKFDVYCFPFDNLKLLFVSGKEHIDDFIINSSNFVVDCHNAYESDYDPDYKEVEEIRHLINLAENGNFSKVGRFKYGFVKKEVESESICNYVAALLLEFDDERYAIVVLDSNNIELRFREHVEKLFAGIGYRAIIVSTDNHEKTGIRAKQSYKPAGGCEKDWKIAEELAENCRNVELKDGEWRYSEKSVRVRVMGEKLLRDSEIAAREKAAPLIANFLGFTVVVYLLAMLIG